MILTNAVTARKILDATHDAWSKGDIDRLVSYFVDDMIYWSNTGANGEPWIIEGKEAYSAHLKGIASVAESVTVSEHFHFSDGIARAKIDGYIRHRQTGHVLSGTYRQIMTFRGLKVSRVDEFHDAAKMAAFWHLVMCDVEHRVPKA